MQSAMDAGWQEQNLSLVESHSDIDAINAEFYNKYPFPPRAYRLERSLDPEFHRIFLCQDVGDWRHRSVPSQATVWVAGCGTNQALITALAFPRASVIGSDISAASLDIAAQGARQLSLSNLDLRQESLNSVQYREEFDYIVCTGVIHHTSDPAAALERIARALKPGGLLELMVYGRYQRITSSAFQKVVLILAGNQYSADDDNNFRLAEQLVNGLAAPGRMGAFLKGMRCARRAELADSLLQPVEHSYTVASLDELARHSGLEMLLPVVSAYDKLRGNFTWELTLPSTDLQRAYMWLDDALRWQVTNLLLGECCPLLWFYFRRASTARAGVRDVCNEFLKTRFTRAATRKQAYQLGDDGSYQLVPGSIGFPPPLHDRLSGVVEAADGQMQMREILQKDDISTDFPEVNDVRVRLTTAAFPYLQAVPE
jgi:SAM-dependent methyltransferase